MMYRMLWTKQERIDVDADWEDQFVRLKDITEETLLENIIHKDTLQYFRDLGGTEELTYVKDVPRHLVSTSPNGLMRIVRTFIKIEEVLRA